MQENHIYQSKSNSNNQIESLYSINQYSYINKEVTKQYVLQLLFARDFYIPEKQYTDFMDNQKKYGNEILFNTLPDFLSENLPNSAKVLEKIKLVEPGLWNRLNTAASFGYHIGMHLHNIGFGTKNNLKPVAFSAALFNTGIALFDYVLDELPEGHVIFDFINEEYLIDIKKRSIKPLSALSNIDSFNLIIQLLFIFVDTFFISVHQLYNTSGNDEQWVRLCNTLLKLFAAEKAMTRIDLNAALKDQSNFETIEYKSVMPFVAMNMISRLTAHPSSNKQDNEVEQLSKLIGNIFWITDDVADIAVDIKNNVPGYITKKMMQMRNNPDQESSIKVALTETVNDLFALYNKLDNFSNNKSLPDSAFIDFKLFIKMYIYSWLSE